MGEVKGEGDGDGVTVVSGGGLSITSAGGIDVDTAVRTISATTTGAGTIVIEESDGVELKSVVASDGPISVSAAGDMVATKVESTTNSQENDVTLITSAGDMTLGMVGKLAPYILETTEYWNGQSTIVKWDLGYIGGDLRLSASGSITMNENPKSHVSGDELSVEAGGEIKLRSTVEKVSAVTTGPGSIEIEDREYDVDHNRGLELKSVVASDGSISVSDGVNGERRYD